MGSNINLLKLAQMLGMGPPKQGQGQGMGLADLAPNSTPPNKPTHGYTISEKGPNGEPNPEVVTAPGVYFPSEKGEVLSPENYNEKAGLTDLIPRQNGGPVTPSYNREDWPLRVDGTKKGLGFFGVLPMTDGSGGVATEYTVGVNLDGKEMVIPSMVPTLNKEELDYILGGGKVIDKSQMGNTIIQKAVDHAKSRMKQGKSPFIHEDEPPAPMSNLPDLIPRQFGGKVDPTLFKNPMMLGEENPMGTQIQNTIAPVHSWGTRPTFDEGVSIMQNKGSNILPTSTPNPSLSSFMTPPPAFKENKSSPMFRSDQEAAFNKKWGPTTEGNSILSSLMQPPPEFKENKSSPIFASDQKKAFDLKWQPYQDMMKKMGETPLFSRATQGVVSPGLEGLTEEEKRRYLTSIGQETATVDMAPNLTGTTPTPEPSLYQGRFKLGEGPWKDVPENYGEGKSPNLIEGSKGSLTVLPGPSTGGPESMHNVKIGGQDYNLSASMLSEIGKNPSKYREQSYYDVHPGERDAQKIYDMLKPGGYEKEQQDYQDFRNRAALESSFGTPASKKAAAEALGLSQKGRTEQEQNAAKMTASFLSSKVRGNRDTYGYGQGVGIYNKHTGVVTIPPLAKPEKTQNEIGLITQANEVGPDGKTPTDAAIRAQNILDAKEKRDVRVTGEKSKEAERNRVKSYEPTVKKIGDAIIEGKQPPIISGFGMAKYQGPLREYLAEQGYDLMGAEMDYHATKKYVTGLNGPQQIRLKQATKFSYDSLDVIDQLNKEWIGGRFPILNKANLKLAVNGALGVEAQKIATKLDTQIADLVSELATVYKGGYASTDDTLMLAAKNLSADWSYEQLESNIGLVRTNLKIRLNSLSSIGGPAALSKDRNAEQVKSVGATPAPTGNAKTVVKKFVSQSTGKTKVVYSDGTEEIK